MALPSTDISIRLVKDTIGEASNDVKALCRSTRINKWSKHKPFQSSATSHDTVAEMEADMQKEDGGLSGYVSRFGLKMYYGYDASFLTQYNEPWKYDFVVAPYRLGDFRLYNQAAGSPMPYLNAASEIEVERDESGETGCEYKATIPIVIPANNRDIKLSEIKFKYNGTTFYLSQCRLAVFTKIKSGASSFVTDTGKVVSDYFGQTINLVVGVTFEQLDVDMWVCALLQYGTTLLRFQLEAFKITKFVYHAPGPEPEPALIFAWHRTAPSYNWDGNSLTIQYDIGYKNTGDLSGNTQIKATIAYGITERDVTLMSSTIVDGHSSGRCYGTQTISVTSADEPEIYYFYMRETGLWDTVRNYEP